MHSHLRYIFFLNIVYKHDKPIVYSALFHAKSQDRNSFFLFKYYFIRYYELFRSGVESIAIVKRYGDFE